MKYSFTPLKPSIFLFGVIFWPIASVLFFLHKKQGIPSAGFCPFPQQFLVALSWARNRILTPPLTTKIPGLEACDKMNQHISLIFCYTWARRKLPDHFKRETNFQQFQISSTSNLTYLLHCPTWMPLPRLPHLISCLPALLWCWRRGSGRVTLVTSLVPLQYS